MLTTASNCPDHSDREVAHVGAAPLDGHTSLGGALAGDGQQRLARVQAGHLKAASREGHGDPTVAAGEVQDTPLRRQLQERHQPRDLRRLMVRAWS